MAEQQAQISRLQAQLSLALAAQPSQPPALAPPAALPQPVVQWRAPAVPQPVQLQPLQVPAPLPPPQAALALARHEHRDDLGLRHVAAPAPAAPAALAVVPPAPGLLAEGALPADQQLQPPAPLLPTQATVAGEAAS
eukprot:15473963-Alexandrium_andersonii.AAC.1